MFRTDPFRGSDAVELRQDIAADIAAQAAEINRRLDAITSEIGHVRQDLNRHLTNHPDQLGLFDRRLGQLEGKLEILQDRVNGDR